MRRVTISIFSFLVFAAVAEARSPGEPQYKRVEKLYTGNQTITGETIRYPNGDPVNIQSLVVTMRPGETTGWHKHGVPTYGYVLSGTLSVDYGEKGKHVYQTGEAFMEAMDWWHNGKNEGKVPARVLVVFMGARGSAAVVRDGAPNESSR
jgi:quercetin dioxygenase-like cupin family protein